MVCQIRTMSESTISQTLWCRWWLVKAVSFLIKGAICLWRHFYQGSRLWSLLLRQGSVRLCLISEFSASRDMFPNSETYKIQGYTMWNLKKPTFPSKLLWYFTNNKSTSFILPNRVGFHCSNISGTRDHIFTYYLSSNQQRTDRENDKRAHTNNGQRSMGVLATFP